VNTGMNDLSHQLNSDLEEKYDIDLDEIGIIAEIGPGLLLEVKSKEDKILIWLE